MLCTMPWVSEQLCSTGWKRGICTADDFVRIASLRGHVDHWTSRSLESRGRVHVAEQVLAAGLWFDGTFVRIMLVF